MSTEEYRFTRGDSESGYGSDDDFEEIEGEDEAPNTSYQAGDTSVTQRSVVLNKISKSSFQMGRNKDLGGLIESLRIDSNELLDGGNPIYGPQREFKKLLGKGGFGAVFQCTWAGRGGGLDVAVKEFTINGDEGSREKVERDLRKEFEVLVSLFHPNVCRVFGFFVEESRCGMVMELCDDNVLDFVVNRFQADPKKRGNEHSVYQYQKLIIMRGMAMGLNYLHCVGVVHRDVKPSNFLINLNLNTHQCGMMIKLADFGLSKILVDNTTHITLGSECGTKDYMAPELFFALKGKKGVPYSKSSDIFALGVSFHHVLYYKVPKVSKKCSSSSDGGESEEIVREVINDGHIPKVLVDMIQRMVSYNRKERPEIKEVLDCLNLLCEENRYRKKMEKKRKGTSSGGRKRASKQLTN